jgi:hypothetical protein
MIVAVFVSPKTNEVLQSQYIMVYIEAASSRRSISPYGSDCRSLPYCTSLTAPAILHQALWTSISVPSNPAMRSDRNLSFTDVVASESRPLLSSALLENDESDVNNATGEVGVTAQVSTDAGTLLEHRGELVACAFNFLLSGIAMAAVGVSMNAHTCHMEHTDSARLCS